MADVSIGSVSLGLQLDKSDLLSQMKDISAAAAAMMQNGLSGALKMGNEKIDLSGIIGGVSEVKAEVKSLADTIKATLSKGVSTGVTSGVMEAAKAVSNVKLPTVKVTATKEDLTSQLDNMLSQLDNTNAKIVLQQQLVDELKRKWAAMGNLGQQDSAGGLALQQKILTAESAMLGLENTSDQMAMKIRAMDSAIVGFGTVGAQSVKKVVAAATSADAKLDTVGSSSDAAGKKIASGMNSANKSVKGFSSGVQSATGLEKRLSSIESNVAKTTRSVTALGRRFMVLFTGKIISAAFKDVTASLTGASEKSDQLKNSLDSLTTAGKTISNGVITAIAPLINIVGPAVGNVSEIIRTFSNRVGMFFAAVTGQSTVLQAKKTFAAYTTGATEAGNAAEKAQKQLAGFDNLNVLQSPTTSSSSSGSGSTSNADDFETVAVKDSAIAAKVRDAIDKVKGPLTELWENVLKPFGQWTISDGIPMLATGLGDLVSFLGEHPNLVKTVAEIALGLAALKAVGSFGLAVKASVTGLGALGSLLGLGGSAAGTGTAAAAASLSIGATLTIAAASIGVAYIVGSLIVATAKDKWDNSTTEHKNTITNAGTTGDMETFQNEVNKGFTGSNLVEKAINWYLGGLGDSSKYVEANYSEKHPAYVPSTAKGNIQATEDQFRLLLQQGVDSKTALEIAVGYSSEASDALDTAGARSEKFASKSKAAFEKYTNSQKTGYKSLTTEAARSEKLLVKSTQNTSSSYATSGASVVGSCKKVTDSVANVHDMTLSLTDSSANAVVNNANRGVSGALNAFSQLPTGAKSYLDSFYANIFSGSNNAMDGLFYNTKRGINDTIPHFAMLANSGSERVATLAENTRKAALAIANYLLTLPTMSGDSAIKSSKQTLASMVFGGGNAVGFGMSLFALAKGGYVGANSPQLAIIGDNTTQGEIVTPENKMAEMVAKGIEAAGGVGQTINLTVQSVLDGKVIAESTTRYQARNARQKNKPAFA